MTGLVVFYLMVKWTFELFWVAVRLVFFLAAIILAIIAWALGEILERFAGASPVHRDNEWYSDRR